MARHDGQYRVWPWVLAAFTGLLTTAGGSLGYKMLGSLIVAGAIVMIVRAVRRNRAARRPALAAEALAARAGKKQATATRPPKTGAGRSAAT